MREIGLTYSATMGGAIWRDEKWQTRRASGIAHVPEDAEFSHESGGAWFFSELCYMTRRVEHIARPRLRVGDLMVVREPWRVSKDYDHMRPALLAREWHTFPEFGVWWSEEFPHLLRAGRYRQAMHMPFAFARSKRIVTCVRVERLGDISEADANAESFYRHDGNGRRTDSPLFPSAAREFAVYWNRINGPGAFDRDRRKWVWVYEFERKGGAA